MVLVALVQFHEVTAPAPYPHNQIAVVFRMLLCIQQSLPVDSVQLQLVSSAQDKQLYQLCYLGDGFILRKYTFREFYGQGAAVNGAFQIWFGKALDQRYGPV